jgi:hypothetical protein
MPTPKYYKTDYFPSQQAALKDADEQAVAAAIADADTKYSKDVTEDRFEAAYTYRAVAEHYENTKAYQKAAEYYHFAAHLLRSLEDFRNAGIVYQKGARAAEQVTGSKKEQLKALQWAVRSHARAKMCYADVGDAQESADAYVAEQEARRRLAGAERKPLTWLALMILWITSKYGQSWRRFLITAFVLVVLYGSAYELLERCQRLDAATAEDWRSWSGPYYAIAVALSFDPGQLGDSSSGLAQWVALSNVGVAWILLGLGAAMVARRVKER